MSTAEMLQALAAGLCQDARVRLEIGGDEWAWSPARRALIVPAHAVAQFGIEACAGVVAHEIGHAYLSRYQLLAEVRAAPAFVRLAMNALEDPRVEGFMTRRYPGAAPWLVASLGAVDPAPPRLPSLQLLTRFVVEGGVDAGSPGFAAIGTPEGLHPDVVAALEATRAARASYVRDHWPALDFGGAPANILARYATEVVPALAEGASPWPPPAAEAWVRVIAHEAFRVARDRIFPAAMAVLEADVDRVARLVDRTSPAAVAARTAVATRDAALAMTVATAAQDPRVSGASAPTAASVTLARAVLDLVFNGHARGASEREAEVSGEGVTREPPSPTSDAQPQPSAYASLLAPVAGDVATLAAALEDVLRPRRRARRVGGFTSGTRVELRRAMEFEADPQRGPRFWQRVTVPDRRSAAFLLLVDLSGSMRNEKIGHALAATVLFAETLTRLQVPFSIAGFQDEIIPVHAFDAPFDDHAQGVVVDLRKEVSGTRSGGHNQPAHNDDGPCLREAAAGLAARSEEDRVLVVLSDGRPSGRRSNAADLVSAVADVSRGGLSLIGIGVGPGTDHVAEYYPRAIASVPLTDLPARVGAVLREVLTRAA